MIVLHLARHDARATRAAYGLFLVALVTEWMLIATALEPGRWLNSVPLMPVIRLILTMLLTALVVHRDPLVGSAAFWRTRPIGRGQLLSSKIGTLVVLLVVVPGAMLGIAWWRTGLWVVDATAIAGIVALEQATVVLLTAMAAMVTASLTHLAVAGVAGVTLVTVINGIVFPALMTAWPFVGGASTVPRPAIYLGVLGVIGGLAVVHQFLTLKEWRSAALVGLALLAAAFSARIGARVTPPAPTPVDYAFINPTAVELTVQPGTMRRRPLEYYSKNRKFAFGVYEAVLDARGNPPAVFLETSRLDARLTLPTRSLASGEPRWGMLLDHAVGQTAASAYRSSLQAALAPAMLPAASPHPWNAQASRTTLLELDQTDERTVLDEKGILSVRATIDAMRYRIAAAVPARPGAVLADRGIALEIVDARPGMTDVLVVKVSRLQEASSWRFVANTFFALRNTRRNEARLLASDGMWRGLTWSMAIARVTPYRTTYAMQIRTRADRFQDVTTPPDAAWLADAELVLLTAESVGTFTREFQTEIVVGK